MKHYRYFDETSGFLHPLIVKATSADDVAAMPAPPGHKLIEGEFDYLSQRIDVRTGSIIDYLPPPPSVIHEWNDKTRRWEIPLAVRERQSARAAALARIAALEVSQARPLRDLVRDPANVEARNRLDAIDAEITALRSNLQGAPETAQ